jgi:hypothetical protein
MKMILIMALMFVGCQKTVNKRTSGSSAKSVDIEREDEVIEDDVEDKKADAEETFQAFLASLENVPAESFKEDVGTYLLAIQLGGEPKLELTEKGRCVLASLKEDLPEEVKNTHAATLEFRSIASHFFAISKGVTLESTDCIDFFKQRLGFRFETHYVSQHVFFFSYNI